MGDAKARIFERERRELGLTAADYLIYLAKETNERPEEILEEIMGVSFIAAVPYDDLEHCDLYQDAFETFTMGDAVYTLVSPQVLIDELEYAGYPEYTPLIRELEDYSNSSTLIAFNG